jgi:hypothetical protein
VQCVRACGKQRPDAAEIVDQALRKRFGVDPRDGQGEKIFDQFIIVKTAGTCLEQALAQPCPVPARIRFLRFAHALVHAAPSLRPSEHDSLTTVDAAVEAVMPRLER